MLFSVAIIQRSIFSAEATEFVIGCRSNRLASNIDEDGCSPRWERRFPSRAPLTFFMFKPSPNGGDNHVGVRPPKCQFRTVDWICHDRLRRTTQRRFFRV